MAFTLEQVVPWGRSYDEYIQMFALSQTDLEKRILGCGDGPAGFNAQLSQQGGRVISVDPIYEFDLALCSHFLFLYSGQFDAKFHLESIVNLCKIANEVRIFPLLELGSKKSRHFDEVIKKLTTYGFKCEVKKVKYEFQKGGNEMLAVNKIIS